MESNNNLSNTDIREPTEQKAQSFIKKINIVLGKIEKSENKQTKEKQKIKEKRIVTNTNKWKNMEDTSVFSYDTQLELLKQLKTGEIQEENREPCSLISQNIRQKLSSYKAQDIKNKKYHEKEFVSFIDVVNLLIEKTLDCYYCQEKVSMLYEFVRESKQWTLDRIDNDYGHNKNNLFISCLTCNLRRRTMYPERYVFTKQMKIKKMD